jgi:sulfite exporter TauE/SafE
MNPEPIIAAFLVGLLGGTHCFGMCGGIVGALSTGLSRDMQSARARLVVAQLAYNGGRISSYTVAGVLLGLFGQQLGETGLLQGMPVGRVIAGVVMILFGIYRWGGVTFRCVLPDRLSCWAWYGAGYHAAWSTQY